MAWLYWNPDPIAFNIPFFDWPVFIYGLCWTIGFILAFLVILPVIARTLNGDYSKAYTFTDKLSWYVIGGAVIGARLGHILFYELDRYLANPLQIFNLREGGLASHGGAFGILIAMCLFIYMNKDRYPQFNFLKLLDTLVVPTCLVGFFIRIGNFYNQEIVGTPSDAPWAVIFGNPMESSLIVPRHPVQLYEAAAYLVIFAITWCIWYFKGEKLKTGVLSGLFFIMLFGARFILEFWKINQHSDINPGFIQMGQWLSLPFILVGILLVLAPQLKFCSGKRC